MVVTISVNTFDFETTNSWECFEVEYSVLLKYVIQMHFKYYPFKAEARLNVI
jgi:hypothetical protein